MLEQWTSISELQNWLVRPNKLNFRYTEEDDTIQKRNTQIFKSIYTNHNANTIMKLWDLLKYVVHQL